MEKTLKNKVNKFIKKFFNFFHLPNFVPKKWYKKLKKIIYEYFVDSDNLEELQTLKDNEISNFNIDDLLNTINEQNSWLNEFFTKIKDIENDIKSNGDSFTAMLDEILLVQNTYNWYNENSSNAIKRKVK